MLRPVEAFRRRVVARATSLFAHAPNPLQDTLRYRGDPGLLGPGSVSWRVIGDAAAFVGGIRALLTQAAHPEVAASLGDHSRYRDDPLGRLSRTSSYVTATTFGAMPEVERAVELVRRAHEPVRGASHRGKPYSAAAAPLAAWVHNALTDSFLQAYQAYGPTRLSGAEADQFVEEQTEVGRLLGADPLPTTAAQLAGWIEDHEELAPSPGMDEAVAFLRTPPLPLVVLPAYKLMGAAATATIPSSMRSILDLRRVPGSHAAGKRITGFLRWSLGASPAWNIALIRCGAPVPPGLFRQRLPNDVPG